MVNSIKLNYFLILLFIFSACNSNIGKVFQTFEKNLNSNKTIKIIARHEVTFVLPGAYYSLEVIDNTSKKQKEIFVFRHDDPINIPVNNFIIKNDGLAYFWIGWKFAVTNDGGETWTVWNAEDQDGVDINYGLIENVEIHPDGSGKMTLNDLAVERSGLAALITKDFGKTWEKN